MSDTKREIIYIDQNQSSTGVEQLGNQPPQQAANNELAQNLQTELAALCQSQIPLPVASSSNAITVDRPSTSRALTGATAHVSETETTETNDWQEIFRSQIMAQHATTNNPDNNPTGSLSINNPLSSNHNNTSTIERREPLGRNQCPMCFEDFGQEKAYVEHMRLVHGNTRPFMCDVCGLYMSYRSSLYNHMKTHSTEKEFVCRICSAKFRWRNSLDYHQRKVHGLIGTSPSRAQSAQPARRPAVAQIQRPPQQQTVQQSPQQQLPEQQQPQQQPPISQPSTPPAKFCPCGKKFYLMEALKAHTGTCSKRASVDSVREIVASVSSSMAGLPTSCSLLPVAVSPTPLLPPLPLPTVTLSTNTPRLVQKRRRQNTHVQPAMGGQRSALIAQKYPRNIQRYPSVAPPGVTKPPMGMVQPLQTPTTTTQQMATNPRTSATVAMPTTPSTTAPRVPEQQTQVDATETVATTITVASGSNNITQPITPATAASLLAETTEQQTLARLCAKQEIMIRRLEGFELWVQEKVGKMEEYLAELVAESRRRNQNP